MINAEDSAEDTVRPRLQARGADLDNVFIWDSSADLLRLPTHLKELDKLLAEVRPPAHARRGLSCSKRFCWRSSRASSPAPEHRVPAA